MAFPLVPFIAGAALGSLATLLYRDDKLRGDIKRTAGDVGDSIKDTAGTVSNKVSDGLSSLRSKGRARAEANESDEETTNDTVDEKLEDADKPA